LQNLESYVVNPGVGKEEVCVWLLILKRELKGRTRAVLCSSVILWIHSGAGFLKIFMITQPLVLIFVKVLEPPKLFKSLAVVMKELAKDQDKDLMFRTKI
jgi:hypothetical protein